MGKNRIQVPILLYHRILAVDDPRDPYCISVAQFEQQLQLLSALGYSTITLSELAAAQWGEQKGDAVEKPLIITFDDGSKDNRTVAYPALQKYGFQATIFMLPEMAGQTDAQTGIEYLSWDDIFLMRDAGFSFQSHGLTHSAMVAMSDEVLRHELRQSKNMLEEKLDQDVGFMAYPFGLFDQHVQRLVEEAGYTGACGGTPQLDGSFPDPFALGRTEIFKNDSMAHFRFKLRQGHSYYYYYKKRLGGLLRKTGVR